jgi:long-chain acyl-CoA synthetase
LYKKVRAAFGGHLRYFIVGGATLADGLHRFLINAGVPISLGYGLTEASPVVAVNRPGEACVGTVGRPFPGVEIRLGDQDEILARGPNIMQGYHRDQLATAACLIDGWLHTGDRGRLDEQGRLIITGRIKELLKTSGGKYVSPVPIEQRLTSHPLLDQAMVLAEGRRFAAALLFTAPEAVAAAKQAENFDGDDAAWMRQPEVVAALRAHVDAVNASLDHWEQIRRWSVVTETPTVENGLLTPTMKLRRHVVSERLSDAIESLYAEEPQTQSSA